MVRNIGSVIAGSIVASLIFLLVEQLGHIFYPGAMSVNWNDAAAVKVFMDNQPIGAFMVVLGGWAVGSFVGGILMQKISKQTALTLPIILSLVLMATAVWNFIMLPHPLWFMIVGLMIFAPSVLGGWKIVAAQDGR